MAKLEQLYINLTMAGVTLWIVNQYLVIFFEKRKRNTGSILIWMLFYLFQAGLEFHKGEPSILVVLLDILFVMLIAFADFDRNHFKKILCVFLLYAFWMLAEILCYYILKVLPVGRLEFDSLGSVVSKLLTISFVILLRINFHRENNDGIPAAYYGTLLFVPMGSIFIAHNIFAANNGYGEGVTTLLAFGILLTINIIIFQIYIKLSASFDIQKENTIYEQQLELLGRNTEEQKKTMEEFHEEKHNLVNKLVVLKENIEHDKKQEAVRDLDEIIQTCSHRMEQISDSGNHVVDALINFKYTIAKQSGIEFRLKIFIPEELPVRQSDLGVVLGNSLDNAIEAVKGCENQPRIIHIFMGLRKEAFVMVIKNPYCHKLSLDRSGNFVTTKRERNRHGYGMSSVRKTVDKYQGEVNAETEDGMFTLTVILNL